MYGVEKMEMMKTENLCGVGVRLLKLLDKKIGVNEVIIWGIKASPEHRQEIAKLPEDTKELKKIRKLMVLEQQVEMVGERTPALKGIPRSTLIYIPNADKWDQSVLLRVCIQAAQSSCKALIGFTDISDLSLSMIQFTLMHQITEDGEVGDWGVNMEVPLKKLI